MEEKKGEKRGGRGVFFWLRLLLLGALLLYGAYASVTTSSKIRKVQAQSLGLRDNDGRLAVVRFEDPLRQRTERYFLLLARGDREERAQKALTGGGRARGHGVFLYYSEPLLMPYQVSEPFRWALLLSPEGIVVQSAPCPSPPCRFSPHLPYKGSVELLVPSRVGFGWRMSVEQYGEELY